MNCQKFNSDSSSLIEQLNCFQICHYTGYTGHIKKVPQKFNSHSSSLIDQLNSFQICHYTGYTGHIEKSTSEIQFLQFIFNRSTQLLPNMPLHRLNRPYRKKYLRNSILTVHL